MKKFSKAKKAAKREMKAIEMRLQTAKIKGVSKTEYFKAHDYLKANFSDEQIRMLRITMGKWLDERIERYSQIAG